MKTFALILRKSAQYHFQSQEASPRMRLKGAIIGDASLENAAFYIAHRMADLYFGPRPRNVEWLNSRRHQKTGPRDEQMPPNRKLQPPPTPNSKLNENTT